ncbi:hypothetical protein H6F88_23965 [Oculatella sp. FACHB-28]|uniref:DUF7219 family protein n=1 Tax=Cyanophyceae TaxID=3028117 RepID=UPI0016826692|nr:MULTISPECIES: hypothetical protein [Cyanophyceae]MBD1996220.1 hypothetical protein [Leptolyngbya sp. FACHB-541]MBD2059016.1 hypothetical protein [Oculatella sp. FACHB-28]MBD2070906.1 hypothetical protein [Leptolyngbya sp. FACHB-671]
MADKNEDNVEQFLYPRARFRGEFSPEHLAFDANLQEFAQRVALICGLETGGKVPPEDAYNQIKQLWQELKKSKGSLLDEPKPPKPELPPEE